MIAVVIIFTILFLGFKRPIYAIGLLLQINIIRSLNELNISDPCLRCSYESSFLLGALTPLMSFLVIIFGYFLKGKRKIKFINSEFDVFFYITIFYSFVISFFSLDIYKSLDFSLRYLILGSSFYFISKLILINAKKPEEEIYSLMRITLRLSIFFGSLASIYFIKYYGQIWRLTLPGVIPIPFSQLLGFGALISFVIFISNGRFMNIKSKKRLKFNYLILPLLILMLMATNTRGVMLALFTSVFSYVFLAKIKIRKRTLFFIGGLMICALIVAINYIDFEVLFSRILFKGTNSSVSDRYIAYFDTIKIFIRNPFGIGPNVFDQYSILPYPHNFFLENMSSFGLVGLFLDLFMILMFVYMLLTTLKYRKNDLIIVFLFSLNVYFFVETMFSFTLWMHKGLYLSLGLFMGYLYRLKSNYYESKPY